MLHCADIRNLSLNIHPEVLRRIVQGLNVSCLVQDSGWLVRVDSFACPPRKRDSPLTIHTFAQTLDVTQPLNSKPGRA